MSGGGGQGQGGGGGQRRGWNASPDQGWPQGWGQQPQGPATWAQGWPGQGPFAGPSGGSSGQLPTWGVGGDQYGQLGTEPQPQPQAVPPQVTPGMPPQLGQTPPPPAPQGDNTFLQRAVMAMQQGDTAMANQMMRLAVGLPMENAQPGIAPWSGNDFQGPTGFGMPEPGPAAPPRYAENNWQLGPWERARGRARMMRVMGNPQHLGQAPRY